MGNKPAVNSKSVVTYESFVYSKSVVNSKPTVNNDPAVNSKPVVYMVCTGNAARSPMATAMLRACDSHNRLDVRSAGTLVLEGHPMGARTRTALSRHGLADHAHRSQQFRRVDAADADLVVVMEPLHVHWMRRNFPEAAAVTGSLRRLAGDLPAPHGQKEADYLGRRVAALDLAAVNPEPWEELVDPAAGDQSVFDQCADELFVLVTELHRRIASGP